MTELFTKVLVIPDIHTKFVLAERIIEKEKPTKIIFLGDYFDEIDDSFEITKQTALWLKKSLTKPNRIHLLGNHDLSYLNSKFATSGFSEEKNIIIKNAGVNLSKLLHYCWINDWLCTHAGLSDNFYRQYNTEKVSVKEFLEKMVNTVSLREKAYSCSFFRGGNDPFGGIVWGDYREFADIPNLKQIFGHSKNFRVRQKKDKLKNSEHICLDTGLQNYAIYENEVMTIHKIN